MKSFQLDIGGVHRISTAVEREVASRLSRRAALGLWLLLSLGGWGVAIYLLTLL